MQYSLGVVSHVHDIAYYLIVTSDMSILCSFVLASQAVVYFVKPKMRCTNMAVTLSLNDCYYQLQVNTSACLLSVNRQGDNRRSSPEEVVHDGLQKQTWGTSKAKRCCNTCLKAYPSWTTRNVAKTMDYSK